jgi:hypothetical protein
MLLLFGLVLFELTRVDATVVILAKRLTGEWRLGLKPGNRLFVVGAVSFGRNTICNHDRCDRGIAIVRRNSVCWCCCA